MNIFVTLCSVALLEADLGPFKDWAKSSSSSSLDHPHNAAIYVHCVYIKVGKDTKSQAIKTAMSHEPSKVEGGRR